MIPKNLSWNVLESSFLNYFHPHPPEIMPVCLDATPFEASDPDRLLATFQALHNNVTTNSCYKFASLHTIVFVPSENSNVVNLSFPAKRLSGSVSYFRIAIVSSEHKAIKEWRVDASDFDGVASKLEEIILNLREQVCH